MSDEEKRQIIKQYNKDSLKGRQEASRYENVETVKAIAWSAFLKGFKASTWLEDNYQAREQAEVTNPYTIRTGHLLEEQPIEILRSLPPNQGLYDGAQGEYNFAFKHYYLEGHRMGLETLPAETPEDSVEPYAQKAFSSIWLDAEQLAQRDLRDESEWGESLQNALAYIGTDNLTYDEIEHLVKVATNLLDNNEEDSFPEALKFLEKYWDDELKAKFIVLPPKPISGVFNGLNSSIIVTEDPALLRYIDSFSVEGSTPRFNAMTETINDLACPVQDLLYGHLEPPGYTLPAAFEYVFTTVAQEHNSADPREIASIVRGHFEDIGLQISDNDFEHVMKINGLDKGEKTSVSTDSPSSSNTFTASP